MSVQYYLKRYSKESGPKVVFRDDSSGDTKGKIENLNEVWIKELRSDNVTEFRNHKWKRISDKRMKNKAKNDKTEHGMEEREKVKCMRTRSSSNLVGNSSSNPTTSNPKRRNRRRSKQPFSLEESPIATMADQCTIAELLRTPTEGYAEAIMVPPILVEHFELKGQLDIAKLTHAVNRQTSDVTTAMTTILKQFQATPPPASVKSVEEICVTCGGAHPYYQCLVADGNTFPEFRDNIKGYVLAAAGNYNQDNSSYRPPGVANQTRPLGFAQPNMKHRFLLSYGSLPSNTVANPKGELKAITTRSGLVLDGPSVPMPPPFINLEEDEHVEETLTDLEHGEFTIKVPPPLVQKAKPPSQRNFVVHQRDPHHLHIPYPSRMNKKKQKEKDEVQIHKFWQMFKQLHINISLVDALILIPKYQKMLKSLLSNKEKLLELANTPLNENCSAVILKKLPEKLGNLKICLQQIIQLAYPTSAFTTQMSLLNYHRINDNIFDPEGDIIENLLNLDKTKYLPPYHDNPLSGNETVTKSSSSPTLTSIEESDLIWEEFESYLVSDSFPLRNSNPSSPLPSLSGSTTSSSPSLSISETSDYSLEEFADELAHFTFPP
ncbi:hypothetical protein Tco_0047844 [Tanacetum coccineum]